MNLFLTYITTIKPGIDRIDISIPSLLYLPIWGLFGEVGNFVKSYEKNKYQYAEFVINDRKLILFKKLITNLTPYKQSRVYLRMLNPTEQMQLNIQEVLLSLSNHYSINPDNYKINQIEVKFDFYCKENTEGEVKKFLEQHLVTKYAGKNCTTKFKGTIYIANGSNIRLCTKGIRIYEKTNRYNAKFIRLEFQYNKEFFSRKKISILSMPFTWLFFNSLRNIDFLDGFSKKGTLALARSIVKRLGPDNVTYGNIDNSISKTKVELEGEIFRKRNYVFKSVREQNQAIVDIKKKHSLSFAQQRFFKPIPEVKQLIQCHADIGTPESNASKRMIFVKSEK